jgi:hypothetical protein
LLVLIFPNRDFSMGYGGKNKKNLRPFSAPPVVSRDAVSNPASG